MAPANETVDDDDLVHKVRGLGDLDLAALLCLTSREHCIISTDAEYVDDLVAELELVASETFGLTATSVTCTPETTLNDLVAGIQVPVSVPATAASTSAAVSPAAATVAAKRPIPKSSTNSRTPSPALHLRTNNNNNNNNNDSYFSPRHNANNLSMSPITPRSTSTPATAPQQQPQQIANVVLARDLDLAPKVVQIQYLELMRTRRIFTRTAVQACPKQFLFVAVLGGQSAGSAPRLTKHLNDHFYISHWHDAEDGFEHLEESGYYDDEDDVNSRGGGGLDNVVDEEDDVDDDDRSDDAASQASSASVVHRRPGSASAIFSASSSKKPSTPTGFVTSSSKRTPEIIPPPIPPSPKPSTFTEKDLSSLSLAAESVHVDIEVERYAQNILAFLRLHRAVEPGSISARATPKFRKLVRSLAALHGLDFATPEMVQLAARKIYVHRIVVVAPERERSMQWGSDLAAVRELLEDVEPEDVVEDVLGQVDIPL